VVHDFSRRHGDFAIAGALVAVQLDEQDRVSRRAIGLLGLGSTPRPSRAAEVLIVGNPVNELVAEDIGQAAMTGLDDIPTNLQGSASYRTQVGAAMAARTWTQAVQEEVAVKQCVNNRSNCRSTELPSRAASNRA
jgi:carbon-monoxide dehydrogenase medium subunit